MLVTGTNDNVTVGYPNVRHTKHGGLDIADGSRPTHPPKGVPTRWPGDREPPDRMTPNRMPQQTIRPYKCVKGSRSRTW
jgi:hypothetical protein